MLSNTRLAVPADATPAAAARSSMVAQGSPHGQVVTFASGEILDTDGADPQEAFYLGSVSKTFTAAIALRLVEQGRLATARRNTQGDVPRRAGAGRR
ncbi:serine hydrolase [Corynebacterium sp. A21]|uniref:serine hydrolase n=1 Tax=Corynebacterium sp. A21 TaxID=3457318 RepID=UPI003FD06452